MSQTEQKAEDGQVANLTILAANAAQGLQAAAALRAQRMENLTEQVRTLTAHNGDLEDMVAGLRRDLEAEREARASDGEVARAQISALQDSLDASENRVVVLQADLNLMTAKFSSAAREFEQFVGTVRDMSELESVSDDASAQSRTRFVESERPTSRPASRLEETPSLRVVTSVAASASLPQFDLSSSFAQGDDSDATDELRDVSAGFSHLIARSAAVRSAS